MQADPRIYRWHILRYQTYGPRMLHPELLESYAKLLLLQVLEGLVAAGSPPYCGSPTTAGFYCMTSGITFCVTNCVTNWIT